MPPLTNFERTYTSINGCSWRFYYDLKIGRAQVTGDDIGSDVYPVYDGIAKGLVLEHDENVWLVNVWNKLVSAHSELGIYLGKNTQFFHSEKHCQLSNNFCPICLIQKKQFHIHHCIESQDGGSDDSKNLLQICSSCHVALTSGGEEDRISKGRAALWHQMAHFGIDFIPSKDSRGGRHPDVSFHTCFPQVGQALERYRECSEEEQFKENQILMKFARVEYQYYRDLGLGKWTWSEFEKIFGSPAKLARNDAG